MKKIDWPIYLVLLALVLGAFLRLWNVSQVDLVSDDAINSFRAIGYFDYLSAESTQSTPISWFTEPVWWQNLSFHDHPPFVFAVQHFFFILFGQSQFVARLPFILVGLISIWLLYATATRWFSREIAALGSLVFAVMSNSLAMSRLGLFEAFVTIFAIAAMYCYLRAEENARWYVALGICLGLGMLSKYTFIFVVPALLAHMFVFRRSHFRKPLVYVGIAVSVVLFSPTLLYNWFIFSTRGHFDAAFSSLAGMRPEDFSSIAGREVGEVSAFGFIAQLFFIANALVSTIALSFLGWLFQKRYRVQSSYALLVLVTLFCLLILFAVGAQARFNGIATPWLALLVALVLWQVVLYKKTVGIATAVVVVAVTTLYSVNSHVLAAPLGQEHITYSAQHSPYRGFTALNTYLDQLYGNTKPTQFLVFYASEQVQEKVRQRALELRDDESISEELIQTMVIYDEDIQWFGKMWVFERRSIYEAKPIFDFSLFLSYLEQQGPSYYGELGFQRFVLVSTSNNAAAWAENRGMFADWSLKEIEKIYDPAGELQFVIFEIQTSAPPTE